MLRTSDFLTLLLFQISHILSGWMDVYLFFILFPSFYCCSLRSFACIEPSLGLEFILYFSNLFFFFLKKKQQKSTTALTSHLWQCCGEMELKNLVSRVLADRHLFEICHENPILNLSMGPSAYYCFFYDSFSNWLSQISVALLWV